MKKLLFFSLLLFVFTNCNQTNCIDYEPDVSLENTQWKFVKSQRHDTQESSEYPRELGKYIIRFKDTENFDFLKACNYSFGNYAIGKDNTISFTKIGLGTEVYCGDFTDWENLMINNLRVAEKFSISSGQLIIHCAENDLFFENIINTDEETFCRFVNEQKFDSTSTVINSFLETLDETDTDEKKIDDLRNWLLVKSCVNMVEIICVSCIKTFPPQSELRVTFAVGNQTVELTMDILMSETPRFLNYHE